MALRLSAWGAVENKEIAVVRWMSGLLALLLTVGLVAGCGPTPEVQPAPARSVPTGIPPDARSSAIVVRIVDGDTLVVRLGETDTKIRLLNVDTPETKDPNQAVQCLGPEASAFLAELLPVGTPVELEYDGAKLDRYGRTLAGVWLGGLLVNAEVARAGLGVPVQFNGQVKFLPPVEEAAAEAERLEQGAYAEDVECGLPGQVDKVVSAMEGVKKPSKQTAQAYGVAIASLVAARRAARKVEELARTARHDDGSAAWLFHDAVRLAQREQIATGLSRADDRLKTLRSTERRLAKQEAAAKERVRERARRERQRAAQAAQERAAERQQRESQRRAATKSPPESSGGSQPPGYTGPRCYAPGGKTWRPC